MTPPPGSSGDALSQCGNRVGAAALCAALLHTLLGEVPAESGAGRGGVLCKGRRLFGASLPVRAAATT